MTQLFEGVGIALSSLRASNARAALTILGIAIGVMVVMAIGSMITGINRGVEDIFNQLGPRTFFVFRYFQAGIHVSDGSDEMSPWRRNPPLNEREADPALRFVDIGYPHCHLVSGLDDVGDTSHARGCQLRDVRKAISLHTNVDDGSV